MLKFNDKAVLILFEDSLVVNMSESTIIPQIKMIATILFFDSYYEILRISVKAQKFLFFVKRFLNIF